MAVAGPIESVIINKRRYTTDAEDKGEVTPGGNSNEVKPNGDGTLRVVRKIVVGEVGGLNLVVDPATDDIEFLQDVQKSGELVPVQVTYCDGTVYNGKAQITDAVKYQASEGTVAVSLAGQFEKL